MSNLFESKVSFIAIDFEPHLNNGVFKFGCVKILSTSSNAWNRLNSFFMGFRLRCSSYFLNANNKRNQSIKSKTTNTMYYDYTRQVSLKEEDSKLSAGNTPAIQSIHSNLI